MVVVCVGGDGVVLRVVLCGGVGGDVGDDGMCVGWVRVGGGYHLCFFFTLCVLISLNYLKSVLCVYLVHQSLSLNIS